jgi:shikimate kinase
MTAPTSPVPTLPRPDRPVVLVGLMGAGKTAIGKRLAQRLGLNFVDADQEIEAAAGCTIEEFFARHGEAAFREGERRVMARLIDQPPHVLSTGGGAFIDPQTRALVKQKGISVWLRAGIDVLLDRVARRQNRPLLKQGDPRQVLTRLIEARYPIYAEADIVVESRDAPPDVTTQDVLDAIAAHLAARPSAAPPASHA